MSNTSDDGLTTGINAIVRVSEKFIDIPVQYSRAEWVINQELNKEVSSRGTPGFSIRLKMNNY